MPMSMSMTLTLTMLLSELQLKSSGLTCVCVCVKAALYDKTSKTTEIEGGMERELDVGCKMKDIACPLQSDERYQRNWKSKRRWKAMTSADVPAASAIDRNHINRFPPLPLPPPPLFIRSTLIRNG